jgi:xylan 1,4-beta-xylosidase
MQEVIVKVGVILVAMGMAVAGCAGEQRQGAAVGALGNDGMYENPIMRGDWSDPGVIRVGEDYYSVRSSFGWQPGLPLVHSRDLLHWEYVGHGFESNAKLLPGDTMGGVWGVDLGYNPNTKQFLIYAPFRNDELLVYYADKPEGPYAVKSLGRNRGIDPGFFADEDGKLYLLTAAAVIHELTPDGLAIARDVVKIDKSKYRFFEGPAIFKHGGYYYLLFSDGGTLPHEPSTISTLRAKSIAGPWVEDPAGPTMFATDTGTKFEGPAHGTLIQTQGGEWYLTYHAHETAYYSLGRQMLMEPVEWTADGWWRPVGGKVPSVRAKAPSLPQAPLKLAQSDEFDAPRLGLQWFFTCEPDFSGKAWSLKEKSGALVVRTQPGDLGAVSALPGAFQQRVIDKRFSFETRVTFDAREGRETAGLHMYHDPLMNFWLASTVVNGEKRIAVGKYTLGKRTDLWSAPNPFGETVHLKVVVDGDESATFYFGPDGKTWQKLGESVYFGASGHHLRDGRRGDPDLGWVGRYKEKGATPEEINGTAAGQANRRGNVWTGATFGVFAVRDGASAEKGAAFEYVRVSKE